MFFYGLLAGYSILYWAGLIALLPLLILTAVSASKDLFGRCVGFTLVGLAVAHLIGLVDVVTFVSANWLYLAAGFAAYLVLSFPYARYFEWRRYLPKLYRERDEEEKSEVSYFRSNNDRRYTTPEQMNEALETHLKEEGFRDPIKALDYKGKFVGWMVWWPYKLLYRIVVKWMLEIFERIRDFFRWLVECFMHKLQADSNRAFEKHKAHKEMAA